MYNFFHTFVISKKKLPQGSMVVLLLHNRIYNNTKYEKIHYNDSGGDSLIAVGFELSNEALLITTRSTCRAKFL